MGIMDEYYPFESGFGSTASSLRWRQLFGNVLADGVVYGYLNQLNPIYNSGAGTVTVDTGAMVIDGMWAALATLQTISVSGNGSIIVSLNLTTKVASVLWSPGEVEYPYIRNSTTYEVPIMSVVNGVATDMRPFVNQGSLSAATVTVTSLNYALAANTTVNYGIMSCHIPEAGGYIIEGHGTMTVAVDASASQSLALKLFANQGSFNAPPPTSLGPLENMEWPGGATGGNSATFIATSRWPLTVLTAGLWIFGWQVVCGSGSTTSIIKSLGVRVSPIQNTIPFATVTQVH